MVILFEMTGDFKIQVAYNCFTVILFIWCLYPLTVLFFHGLYLKQQESDLKNILSLMIAAPNHAAE